MSTSPSWIDEELAREKEAYQAPLVTIFGAGISGLTAAHELIERGFVVQVVEPTQDPDDEYGCLVGGLAANQFVHTPADLQQTHPHLFNRDPDSEDLCREEAANLVAWVYSQADEQLVIRVGDQDPLTVPIAAGDSKPAVAIKVRNAVNTLDDVNASLDAKDATKIVIESTVDGKATRISFRRDDAGDIKPSQVVRFEDLRLLGRLRSVSMIQAPPRFAFPEHLRFKRSSKEMNWKNEEDDHEVSNKLKLDEIWERLKEAHSAFVEDRKRRLAATATEELEAIHPFELSDRSVQREELLVEIRGNTDGEASDPEADRQLSCKWAGWVRDELLTRNASEGGPIEGLDERLVTLGLGRLDPVGNPRRAEGRAQDNRVEIRVVENILPGEHGYRFFPRFYRHLFDTMKRTPILAAGGLESGQTALDQLEATETVDVALRDGKSPESIPVRRPDSLEELRKLIRIHLDEERMDVTATDLLKFQIRILKFLTSSKARREREYEELSWMDFLIGRDHGAKKPRPRDVYTRKMVRLLRDSPQALLAMNANETDARSQGVIYCQLLLDGLGDGEDANKTLNGPTSSAWLNHWKAYLKHQGVRFYQGRLNQLKWGEIDGGGHELVPEVELRHGTAAEVSFVVHRDVRGDIKVDTITVRPDLGLPDLTAITNDMAKQINDSDELLLKATVEMIKTPGQDDPIAGRVDLRSHIPADGNQLRVTQPPEGREGFGLGPLNFRINGIEVLREVRDDGSSVRDQIVAAVTANDRVRLRAGARGARLIGLDPEEGKALVSVERPGLARYSLRVDGHPITVKVGPAADIGQILDALGSELSAIDYGAEPMGRDGLLVSRPLRLRDRFTRSHNTKPEIDLVANGGLRHGAIVEYEPAWSGVLDLENPNPRVISMDSSIGVVGNQPENPLDSYIAPQLDSDGRVLAAPGGGPDFFVLAVPFEEASRLIWDAWAAKPGVLDGCFEEFRKFELKTNRRNNAGDVLPPNRNLHGRPVDHDDEGNETPARYPLRELSGIQYYFENHVRVGEGHSYFPDAPWGLSSISQLTYWRQRMSSRSAFLGQLSVDIGNWYRSYKRKRRTVEYPSAWRSTVTEIAARTWEQILEGMWKGKATSIVEPRWFHLDDGIRFEHEGVYSFGMAALLRPEPLIAGQCKLRLDGQDLSTSSADPEDDIVDKLVTEVQNHTSHLAVKLVKVEKPEDPNQGAMETIVPPRLAIAPIIKLLAPPSGSETIVRIAVEEAVENATYRLRINGVDVTELAAAGDTAEDIRDALAASVTATVPSVLVLLDAEEPAFLVKSTAALEACALAVPPDASEFEPLLELDSRQPFIVSGLEQLTPIGGATPVRNATPFLINGPEVWKYRPGFGKFLAADDPNAHPGAIPSQGESRSIRYAPTCKRWLMVGNHMATHTRLSTMESANESARHAVIAILHTLGTTADKNLFHGAGQMFGDMPEIFDPELEEIDDLLPLRRLDEALSNHEHEGGGAAPIPHIFDILRVEEMVDQAAEYQAFPPKGKELTQLLEKAGPSLAEKWDFTDIDEIQKALQTLLASLVAVDAPSEGS